ncbi:MAG: anthranilate/aminodeoxychorismate synthase component II [Gammaproteobacteria bacterium]|nr:anthranilate/aminodeoxychorismate synthase component II [Gammaproteobacteria bacterium]HAO56403.1 anthranilate/aminodeoxychorismate synthase component II [Gammaproteobacteria bacterium]
MIDNYDSFTYNVVQYLQELGAEVDVYRNDAILPKQIEAIQPDKIVISPGPCTPSEAGISMEVIRDFRESIPILGICLGHQCVGQVFGGNITHARQVMHGKLSRIYHNGLGIFSKLPNPLMATRYHSLIVQTESLPENLEVTAWTKTDSGDFDEIMGVRHKEYAVDGVQFHPESIKSQSGHELLANFLNIDTSR